MKTCNCTLPYTNPDSCKTCPNNTFDDVGNNWYPYPYEPYTVPLLQPETVKVKRTTKTIEKYGPNGEYIGKEVITEEVEDFDRQVYSGNIIITSGESTTVSINNTDISGDTVIWNQDDPNNLWSYTSCENTGQVSFCAN